MSEVVHMKKMTGNGNETVPLCNPRKLNLVASYNWSSVTCDICRKKRKKK